MSTCARCGDDDCDANNRSREDARRVPCVHALDTIACRDRELANLRSLLRSVTGKLEKAYDRLEHISTLEVGPRGANAEIEALLLELDSVLEALS